MRGLAFLLAALAFAGPQGPAKSWRDVISRQAAEHTWDGLDRAFASEAVRALGALASTREHLAFVKRRGIDLLVVSVGDKLPEGAMGSYVDADRAMYINEADLMSGAKELRASGTPEPEVPRVLAWKFLPTIVHEIRHGITRQRARERAGLNVRMNPLESEFISFLDEIRVLREALRARPELWADRSRVLEIEKGSAILLRAVDKDVGALKALVRGVDDYASKPVILEAKRETLVDEYRRRRRTLVDAADQLLQADTGRIKDPDVRADLAEYALSVADALNFYNDVLGVLEKPAAHAKLRDFYAAELRAMERAVAKPR
ncbi:MAG: hypothetical protein HY554_18405 [Elusimicrobia bacterium]|nr:hypothetical protein [Elusimicrobiota bacterium]